MSKPKITNEYEKVHALHRLLQRAVKGDPDGWSEVVFVLEAIEAYESADMTGRS